jgi:hypothetical protein
MRYFILLLPLIILSCSSQPKDCSKFKTGTFKYKNSDYSNYLVTRNDSVQIEADEKNNTKTISSIEWVSDCEYTLTCKEVINLSSDIVGLQVQVKIIETSNNNYKYISTDGSRSINLEMIKIK